MPPSLPINVLPELLLFYFVAEMGLEPTLSVLTLLLVSKTSRLPIAFTPRILILLHKKTQFRLLWTGSIICTYVLYYIVVKSNNLTYPVTLNGFPPLGWYCVWYVVVVFIVFSFLFCCGFLRWLINMCKYTKRYYTSQVFLQLFLNYFLTYWFSELSSLRFISSLRVAASS